MPKNLESVTANLNKGEKPNKNKHRYVDLNSCHNVEDLKAWLKKNV